MQRHSRSSFPAYICSGFRPPITSFQEVLVVIQDCDKILSHADNLVTQFHLALVERACKQGVVTGLSGTAAQHVSGSAAGDEYESPSGS